MISTNIQTKPLVTANVPVKLVLDGACSEKKDEYHVLIIRALMPNGDLIWTLNDPILEIVSKVKTSCQSWSLFLSSYLTKNLEGFHTKMEEELQPLGYEYRAINYFIDLVSNFPTILFYENPLEIEAMVNLGLPKNSIVNYDSSVHLFKFSFSKPMELSVTVANELEQLMKSIGGKVRSFEIRNRFSVSNTKQWKAFVASIGLS